MKIEAAFFVKKKMGRLVIRGHKKSPGIRARAFEVAGAGLEPTAFGL